MNVSKYKRLIMDCKHSFAVRLKELMTEFNYGQRIVSEKIGSSRSIVSKWLHEQREPTLSNLWKLADLFNCSIDVLSGRAEY